MPTPILCPDAQALKEYLLGQTPEQAARDVEEHVAVCSACALKLNELTDRDTLAQPLPRQAVPVQVVGGEVEALIGRLCQRADVAGLAAAVPVADVLGDFRIVREIGRGGMGVVYVAEQISLSRKVALKVLPFAAALDQKQLQRFKNEAQAAAQLHHTNIVPVYYVGCERGVHFYAMQFIEGQSLAGVLDELRQLAGRQGNEKKTTLSQVAQDMLIGRSLLAKPHAAEPTNLPPCSPVCADADGIPRAPSAGLPSPSPVEGTVVKINNSAFFRTVAQLAVQAAEALEHAHQSGVIHRDIKPANLLVDGRGKLWITDFGLAHCQSQAGLTLTGDLVGTLRYMSPEQALAKRIPVDHRTDVYSLGATLYELLTLEPAFAGRDREEVLQQIAFEEPKPPRRLNKAMPKELETIVLRGMEKNPAERYATAQELADDLHRFLEDRPIQARRPGILARVRKWSWRHRGAVTAAAVATVVALGLSAGLIAHQWYLADQRRIQAERAGSEARKAQAVAKAINRFLIKDLLSAARPERRPPRTPTVEEILDRAAKKIDSALSDGREEEASVRLAIGFAYRSLGLYAKAEPHLQRALTLRQELLGGEHAETLEALKEIGALWLGQDKPAEAEQLHRQALATARRVLGDGDNLTMEFEHLIACALMEQDRLEDSEKMLRGCLRRRMQILGEGDPDTLETMGQLALLLRELPGKWDEAERLDQRCLEIRERTLGKNHPDMLDARLEQLLEKPVMLERGIDANTPLRDAVDFFSNRYGFGYMFDGEAFTAKGVAQSVEYSRIGLSPLIDVNLGTVLQVMLKQVKGTYKFRNHCLLVVPLITEKQLAKKRRISVRQLKVEKELRDKLAKPVDFEKGIDDTTRLKDALHFIGDRHGLNIMVDARAFQSDKNPRDVDAESVKLPKLKGVSLGTALHMLLKPIKGDYEIIDNLILIVPEKSKASS